MRLLSIFLILIFTVSPASHAQLSNEANEQNPIKVPTADFSDLKHTKSGRVDKVIDGLTILLKDGTLVRLASIDIPDFQIWRDAPHSEAALEILEKTLSERTEVMIYQTPMAKKGRINRMKQELGHLVVKEGNIWIQGLLLSEGLARVYTMPDANQMARQMLDIEQEARAGKRGLWGEDSEYLVLTPETASQSMGELAIVEGTVKKTATVKNNVYLNFGQNWKEDFTIMITPDLRKKLAYQGIDPLGLAQKTIRVRGWLREYNGPLIELEDTTHLEYLNPAQPLQNTEESPNLGASLTN